MDFSTCKHAEFCGGCAHQGIAYNEQLATKEQEVRELFDSAEIAPVKFDHIEGCPEEHRYAYRNKMEYTFGDMTKGGPLCLGMHQLGRFMSVVTVDECQIVDDDFNKILRYTLDFVVDKGYVKYHKRKHQGLLRNLVVRKGERTGEMLVNIVTSTQGEFAEDEWTTGLLALPLKNEIVGVMHTFDDNVADAVKCEELKLLYGRDYYMEEIFGLKFKVHEFSFFQTNVEAIERLYSEAIDLIDDFNGKNVFDLYCGTGTISQVMALKAAHVLGVEIVEESVAAAKENAEMNHLENCEFVCGDVFKVLETRLEKPDVIVVDPPRVGMSVEAVEKIAKYGVPQIVYISCNPKTLVKNLVQFQECGYEVSYVKPFDNFPMTMHVETVVLMSRVEGK